jgi:Protein of unknown function (DUF4232)
VRQLRQDRVQRTRCWLLGLCVASLAVAFVLAGRAMAGSGTSVSMYRIVGAGVRGACTTSELRLSRGVSRAATGTSYVWYRLTNVGPAECSLIGYPGVAILGADGRVVQHPAVWSTNPGTVPPERVRSIALATGQQARFLLASTDVTPSPGCRVPYTGRTLQVFPPNQATAILQPYHGNFCDLVVGPVQPGRLG